MTFRLERTQALAITVEVNYGGTVEEARQWLAEHVNDKDLMQPMSRKNNGGIIAFVRDIEESYCEVDPILWTTKWGFEERGKPISTSSFKDEVLEGIAPVITSPLGSGGLGGAERAGAQRRLAERSPARPTPAARRDPRLPPVHTRSFRALLIVTSERHQ